jgi:hypothetical protein
MARKQDPQFELRQEKKDVPDFFFRFLLWPKVVSGKDGHTQGSDITIAGQTAPSSGITLTLRGIELNAECHDILIQHIRICSGDTTVGGVLRDG